jgi:hypothetical protein
MDDKTNVTTRRGALARMAGVAAGAFGLGALTRSKADAASTPAKGDLTLFVPHMRQRQIGNDPSTSLPFGAVVDAKGRTLGTLHTAMLDSTSGALRVQTFELDGGTIVGLGSNGAYVVVGSTGKYAAAAGAYAERDAKRLPGRQFTFTLREGTHGS